MSNYCIGPAHADLPPLLLWSKAPKAQSRD